MSGDARAVRPGLAVLLVTVIACPVPLRAETLYVIEQLVVAVSSAPDPSGERVATLKSGDRVEMLERAGEQVHVRLANGREGWVRASYLSADEPLRVRLAQRDAELARLNDEMSLLKAQPRAAPAAAGGAAAAATATAAVEDPATPPPGALFSAGEERPRPLWPWTLAAAVIGCGIGFGLGAFMLDRHIRRKYGGLRIY